MKIKRGKWEGKSVNLWQWFCGLGSKKTNMAGNATDTKQNARLPGANDGTEEYCSKLCGQSRCCCGGTTRGLHCVWSHYRKPA